MCVEHIGQFALRSGYVRGESENLLSSNPVFTLIQVRLSKGTQLNFQRGKGAGNRGTTPLSTLAVLHCVSHRAVSVPHLGARDWQTRSSNFCCQVLSLVAVRTENLTSRRSFRTNHTCVTTSHPVFVAPTTFDSLSDQASCSIRRALSSCVVKSNTCQCVVRLLLATIEQGLQR